MERGMRAYIRVSPPRVSAWYFKPLDQNSRI
jgi:hypothetical protein